MFLLTLVLSVLILWASLHDAASTETCQGTHCFGGDPSDGPGSRTSKLPRQFNPAAQRRAAQTGGSQNHHVYPGSPRAHSETNPSVPLLRARNGDGGGALTRTRGGCVDADCVAAGKQFQPSNDTRACKGIECRLPPRIRPQARGRSCVGEGCPAASHETVSSAAHLSPVYLSDGAAQFLGDFPELGHASSEHGGAPLGVQLTCDIKPGVTCLPFICLNTRMFFQMSLCAD